MSLDFSVDLIHIRKTSKYGREAYTEALRTPIGPFKGNRLALHLNTPNVIDKFSEDYTHGLQRPNGICLL
jgi:hypothetical protein